MRTVIAVLLSLFLTAGAALAASDPAAEVKAAETAFAKALADRDLAKFTSFIAEDATFLGGKPLKGKEAVAKGWSRFFQTRKAPFSWRPETVVTNAAGTMGLSSGPVLDEKGEKFSTYYSIWVKQADGSWKVLFDGPGCPVCPACAK